MAVTTPPTITALPTPPSRSDPVNFAARGDAFLGALPTFQSELNSLGTNVYVNASDAAQSATNAVGSASAAFTQAQAAASSAAAAAASSGASMWVSGTSYAQGVVVWSPLTYLSYRRKTAGAGTTDPSLDTTNWALIGAPSVFPTTPISTNTSAIASTHYIITATCELLLPSAPAVGAAIQWTDISGTKLATINPNGKKIRNVAGTMTLATKNTGEIIVFSGDTLGWI